MLFSRYASPFLFLETLITNGALKNGLRVMFEKVEEEKLFDLYKAYSANPFAELPSFAEWKDSAPTPQNADAGLNKAQVNTAVDKAQSVLDNFVPQK